MVNMLIKLLANAVALAGGIWVVSGITLQGATTGRQGLTLFIVSAILRVGNAGGIDDVVVTSSGTGGWHSGDPMDRRAAAALARRGYDGCAHRAREFRNYWFGERDLVLAMDSGHLSTLVRSAGAEVAVPIEL